MYELLILILLGLIFIILSLLWWRLDYKKLNSKSDKMLRQPPRQPPPGECPHTSNVKLKVTAMGDREDYYLCKLCRKKVRASELYYFEKGGI